MIQLRELRAGDEHAVQRIYSPEAVRYLGRGPMGEDEAQLYISRAVAAVGRSSRTEYSFGIEVDSDPLGVAKLNTDSGDGALS